jgi:D-sedoheptulose 7-phosphate isomerase
MAEISYETYAEEYLARHLTFLSALPTRVIGQAIETIWAAHQRGATVYLCGNGGSAAIASHFASDLGKTLLTPAQFGTARRLRAVALTDNVALITAWGNDEGYQRVFAEQLRTAGRPDDILIAISGSGNSANILAAVTTAAEIGMTTIGMSGQSGGRLRSDCDICICVDTDADEHNQPLHAVVCKMITYYLRQRLVAQTVVSSQAAKPDKTER